MSTKTVSIWTNPFPDLHRALTDAVESAVLAGAARARVFFRADDIGEADRRFVRMIDLFSRYNVPLALAVVPAWLKREKWGRIRGICEGQSPLWCWHQHGWQHVNHESEGKKQEFGPARTPQAIRREVLRGKQRLADIMDDAFYPVFTPPWNRCSGDTLHFLLQAGFMAVSRCQGAEPQAPAGLPDLQLHVDLHTRKESDEQLGRDNLLNSMQQALSAGSCGFMLHHRRMNENAFVFLEQLLQVVVGHTGLKVVGFRELIEDHRHHGRK